MPAKKTMCLFALGVMALIHSVQAERFDFIGYKNENNNWTNEALWVYSDKKTPSGIPGPLDIARLLNGAKAEITSDVVVGSIHLASAGSATLIINGGSLTATLTSDYNSVGYASFGSIVVQNKGSATFNSRFFVGHLNAPSGSLTIHEGTVRVANAFYHNENYAGSEVLYTRTTIHKGGLLDVDSLMLNAGVMDIAGGT
ncbi:MAG: hypothetical protein MUC65_09075, partial [Pontiellaceae bacterium]|nr:hypothetical protein [Pontiellaceae bacterium]